VVLRVSIGGTDRPFWSYSVLGQSPQVNILTIGMTVLCVGWVLNNNNYNVLSLQLILFLAENIVVSVLLNLLGYQEGQVAGEKLASYPMKKL